MSVQQNIEQKLTEALKPSHLEVLNESHMHSGPAEESHFKVTIVSDHFDGKRLIQRHQAVNSLLKEELAGVVHALAMHTYTPAEWSERGAGAPLSPRCRGGE